MIVILEGVNGVGKSAIAKELSYQLDIGVIRPFKGGDEGLHWGLNGETQQEEWNELRVPVNTHVDDFYVADMLWALKANAILDRSMPSAIAYGIVQNQLGGWYRQKGMAQRLLIRWSEMIGACQHPVLCVWLNASYDVVKHRCDGRWSPNKAQYEKLNTWFNKIFQGIKFNKKQINTGMVTLEGCVNLIKGELRVY